MIDDKSLKRVNKFSSNSGVRVICSMHERCLQCQGLVVVCACIGGGADPPSGGTAETTRKFLFMLAVLSQMYYLN